MKPPPISTDRSSESNTTRSQGLSARINGRINLRASALRLFLSILGAGTFVVFILPILPILPILSSC
jgi:hypothetical protein